MGRDPSSVEGPGVLEERREGADRFLNSSTGFGDFKGASMW